MIIFPAAHTTLEETFKTMFEKCSKNVREEIIMTPVCCKMCHKMDIKEMDPYMYIKVYLIRLLVLCFFSLNFLLRLSALQAIWERDVI